MRELIPKHLKLQNFFLDPYLIGPLPGNHLVPVHLVEVHRPVDDRRVPALHEFHLDIGVGEQLLDDPGAILFMMEISCLIPSCDALISKALFSFAKM